MFRCVSVTQPEVIVGKDNMTQIDIDEPFLKKNGAPTGAHGDGGSRFRARPQRTYENQLHMCEKAAAEHGAAICLCLP